MERLVQAVEALVTGGPAPTFETMALEAFAMQYERLAPYRGLCERHAVRPGEISDWRLVPMVPTSAFKSVELSVAPPRETFRSSGTQGDPSVHRHPFPDLYRATIDASFPRACLPGAGRFEMLSLVPSRSMAPDSSLGFMIDHVLTRWGGTSSVTAVGPRGLEVAKARSWLGARQRERAPCVVLGASFALAELVAALARLELRFRLPVGSVVFDTGGFKARTTELSPAALLAGIEERLGVPPQRVVREYGMTELTSQCYTRALTGGDRDLFVAPPWTRARVLDPESLGEAPPGTVGLLALFDLANLGSAAHLLTQDLAIAEADGFRLAGRAAGAELRGCSLLVEELSAR